jgi:hypothetical protein
MRILILIWICMFAGTVCAQRLEAESIPYRFYIDEILEFEEVSEIMTVEIEPYRSQIRDRLEKEVHIWYDSEGKQLVDDPSYMERLISRIETVTPQIIHDVGLRTFEHCNLEMFFIESSLEFELAFTDFKPFRIGIPLSDVESFRNNSDRLQFENHRITFNDEDQFVISYVEITNPVNGRKYFFHNSNEEALKAPSFNIHLPNSEF